MQWFLQLSMLIVLQITTNKFGESADSKNRFVLKYFAHAQCLFIKCSELKRRNCLLLLKVYLFFIFFVITIFAFADKSSDRPYSLF